MIKTELRRLILSPLTLVLLVIPMIPAMISMYMSYSERQLHIDQLHLRSEDLNIENVQRAIDNSQGLTFFMNFLHDQEYYLLFVILLFIAIGFFLGSNVFRHKESGYGNHIMTRQQYQTYLHNTIITHSIYIFIITTALFLIIGVMSFVIGGWSLNFSGIGDNNPTLISLFFGVLLQLIILNIYLSVVNAVVAVSPVFVTNKYIIQTLPVFIFMIPIILGNTIANFSGLLANIIIPFIPLISLNLVYDIFMFGLSFEIIVFGLAGLIGWMIIFIFTYTFNIKRFSRDYL